MYRHLADYVDPETRIYECSHGNIPLHHILDVESSPTDMGMSHESLEPRWSTNDGGNLHTWQRGLSLKSDPGLAENFNFLVFESNEPIGMDTLRSWILNTHGVVRVKGIVYWEEHRQARFVVQCSGRGRIEVTNSGPWSSRPSIQLCVIGIGMNVEDAKEKLINAQAKAMMSKAHDESNNGDLVVKLKRDPWCSLLLSNDSSLYFTIQFPGKTSTKKMLRHLHHLNIDQMNKDLVVQVNSSGKALIASVDVQDLSQIGNESSLAKNVIVISKSCHNWAIISARADEICRNMLKQMSECMCGF